MTDNRRQDVSKDPAPTRSERIYSEQDLWYFRTREGNEVGPFRYRSEAQSNLERFIQQLKDQLN